MRTIFLDAGIEADSFDAAANSFEVLSLMAQQKQQAIDAQVRGVPAVIVNGIYQVNRMSVDSPAELAELVEFVAALN